MFVGWQGSLTLVTTSDGYAQWYEESALGAQLINAGWSLTQGNIDGLSSTADYAGPATEAFLNAGPPLSGGKQKINRPRDLILELV